MATTGIEEKMYHELIEEHGVNEEVVDVVTDLFGMTSKVLHDLLFYYTTEEEFNCEIELEIDEEE